MLRSPLFFAWIGAFWWSALVRQSAGSTRGGRCANMPLREEDSCHRLTMLWVLRAWLITSKTPWSSQDDAAVFGGKRPVIFCDHGV
jgi:hypothetical protein